MSRRRPQGPSAAKLVRCAIYVRKSTEEGLEQEYNSLDAQHDACAAFIASQRHEGWIALPARYVDGGFSGGNMERPGLKQLMADVEAGKVDVIVVYKVDRLTRSLADFAKIVDILDARHASFVSVTQSFNTTTSMGRLTLNVLLSFAQFEREVTGERIRDKIAASKKKGLWMGGPVPLGYEVVERKLVINETEATLVRQIYRRYLDARSVDQLASSLNDDGHRTKVQRRASGPHRGGCIFRRGTLYHLLSNRIYLGEIVHKGTPYAGEHQAIVPVELFEAVQQKLADRGPGAIDKQRAMPTAPLLGLLYDSLGRAMTSSHTRKGQKRYRYYVTRDASDDQSAWRVSAHELEQIVTDLLGAFLRDRDRIARMVVQVDPMAVEATAAAAHQLATSPRIRGLGISRIDVRDDRVDVQVDTSTLLRTCGLEAAIDDQPEVMLSAPITRVRRGHELRLIVPSETTEPETPRNKKLVRLLADAMEAQKLVLGSPDRLLNDIAAAHGRCRKRLTKLLRISWLAPEIMQSILDGKQPANLTTSTLLNGDLPLSWSEQVSALS